MDYKKLIKDTYELCKNNKAFIIVLFAAMVVSNFASGLINFSNTFNKNDYAYILILTLLSSFIGLVGFGITVYLGNIAIVGVIKGTKRALKNEKLTWKDVYNDGKEGWVKMLGLNVLIGVPLVILAIPLWLLIGIMLITLATAPAIGIVFGILILGYLIVFIVGFAVVLVVQSIAKNIMVLESKGVADSIKLAITYCKENKRIVAKTFGVYFGLAILIGIVTGVIFSIVGLSSYPIGMLARSLPIVGILVGFIYQLVAAIIQTAVIAVFSSAASIYWTLFFINNKKDK
jgi:hypothetical protein